jgi:DNA-binding transcriptional LysR family regulator
MTTIDLNLVVAFVKVVESGSFTAGARALDLPTSSISRAVARLEDTLGTRLLQRTTRKLHLTAAGEHYFGRVREAIGGLDQASAAVLDMGQAPRGQVRVSAAGDMGDGVLSAIVARFVARHPGIEVDVVLTGRWVNLVDEGFDLALRAGTLQDSSLVAHKIVRTEVGIYAAPSYLARRGRPKRFADLARHDCVIYRRPNGALPWRLTGPRGPEQVSVSGPVAADDPLFVRGLVVAGVGLGMLPEIACGAEVREGRLVRLLPAYAVRSGALYVVSPPLKHVPARVSLFRDHLIAELKAWFAARWPETKSAA